MSHCIIVIDDDDDNSTSETSSFKQPPQRLQCQIKADSASQTLLKASARSQDADKALHLVLPKKALKLVIVRSECAQEHRSRSITNHHSEHDVRTEHRPPRDAATRALQCLSSTDDHIFFSTLAEDEGVDVEVLTECATAGRAAKVPTTRCTQDCSGGESDGEYCDTQETTQKRRRKLRAPAAATRLRPEDKGRSKRRALDKDDLRLVDRAVKGLPMWEERAKYKRRKQLNGLTRKETEALFDLIGKSMNWEIAAGRVNGPGGNAKRVPAYLSQYWASTLKKAVVEMHAE